MIVDDPWEFLYVPVQKYLYLLHRPTDSLKCDMLSFLLLQSSAWYTLRQARKPLYKLRKYTSDSTHIGTCCTYSYASWCYTQWEINSPFAKQKHPWLYFCYVLQSSPSSLFFYVAPQINFYLQGRGSGSSCARINDSPACLIYIPRPNFWHALRLATAAERVRKRSVDQSGQAVLWAKICFCCEPCSCIFEI